MNTLFIASSAFGFISGLVYIRYIQRKHITINLTTRIIRLFIEIINILSYFNILEDKIKSLIAVGSGLAILMIIIVGLFKGEFKKITGFDVSMFSVGCLAIIVGLITDNLIITSVLLQAGFVIGYLPTIIGIYKGELKDKALPRIIGGTGGVIGLVGLIIFYESRFSLVYPIVRIGGNLAVISAIIYQKRRKTKILYVCTGNIFRSMSAEHLTRKYFTDNNITNIEVSSAGTKARPMEAFHTTTTRLHFYGCNTSEHIQRKISKNILQKQDIIICMTKHHQKEVEKLGFKGILFNEIAYNKNKDLLDETEYIKLNGNTINLEKYFQEIIDYIHEAIPHIIKNISRR